MTTEVDKLHRRPWVEDVTGLSKSSIAEYVKQNLFPKPVRLGPRAIAWRESEVLAWLASRKSI